jgi:hypothetical protein
MRTSLFCFLLGTYSIFLLISSFTIAFCCYLYYYHAVLGYIVKFTFLAPLPSLD